VFAFFVFEEGDVAHFYFFSCSPYFE
jgi:hypothetical protein